jgi:acetyl esterase
MSSQVYSSELDLFEVNFPILHKMILERMKPALHRPVTLEQATQARIDELYLNRGLMKLLIYGLIPKLKKIEDRIIPNHDFPIPIRLYTPIEAYNLPTIIYYHGGGYVTGSIALYDSFCRKIAKELKSVVISVDYRLAPQFRFPTALEDCYTATKWITDHITEFHGNPKKVYVMGDSAGGGLATLVSIRNRDRNDFHIAGQILIYPWVDGEYKDRSFDLFAKGYMLTRDLMEIFIECYITDHIPRNHPEISPINVVSLKNLPPTFLLTASHDPLRDQGNRYARRLRESGNQLVYKNYLGVFHGFIFSYGIVPRGKKIFRDFIDTIKNSIF